MLLYIAGRPTFLFPWHVHWKLIAEIRNHYFTRFESASRVAVESLALWIGVSSVLGDVTGKCFEWWTMERRHGQLLTKMMLKKPTTLIITTDPSATTTMCLSIHFLMFATGSSMHCSTVWPPCMPVQYQCHFEQLWSTVRCLWLVCYFQICLAICFNIIFVIILLIYIVHIVHIVWKVKINMRNNITKKGNTIYISWSDTSSKTRVLIYAYSK